MFSRLFSNLLTARIENIAFLKIVGLSCVIFAVAANLAWLNPNPFDEVYRTTHNFPFFWQYNPDAGVELLTAVYFPEIFHTYETRINRPFYPISAQILGKLIYLVSSPFISLDILEATAAGYLLFKLLIFSVASWAAFSWFRKFFSEKESILGAGIIFFSPLSLEYAGAFHTTELQFISPIFIIWFVTIWLEKTSLKNNFIYSILVGVLLLGKQNYAIYLSILLIGLIYSRYTDVVLSFIFHLIPLLGYLVFLESHDFTYSNYEADKYGQGVWIFEDFLFLAFNDQILILTDSLRKFLIAFSNYYGFFVFFGIMGVLLYIKDHRLGAKGLICLGFFFGVVFIQAFAALRYKPYMVADLSFLMIFGTLYFIGRFAGIVAWVRKRVVSILAIYLLISLFSIMTFPWESPFSQKFRDQSVLDARVHEVESNSHKR